MATADSVIRVTILGDTKKLIGALDKAEGKLGGLAKKGIAVAGGLGLVAGAFKIGQDALENADKFEDALSRIEGIVSPEFAKSIESVAFNMADIGLSAPEVAEMAAAWAALATSAKVSEPVITAITPDLLALATALAAETGKTADEVITDIGKAAAGNKKSVADYGIVIDSALNPDAQILSIMAQLKTIIPDVKGATDDYFGAQDKLGAKWDNFLTKVGQGLEGPLTEVVDWINDMVDAIPGAMAGWGMLGDRIVGFGRTVLGPLGNVRDILESIIGLFDNANGKSLPRVTGGGTVGGGGSIGGGGRVSGRQTVGAVNEFNDRHGIDSRIYFP